MKIFRKFFIVLILFNLFIFSGCTLNTNIDNFSNQKIDMQPRLIGANSSVNTEQMVENVAPAVVGISALYNNGESVGSGVSIAPGGYIVTNDHVVSGAKAITVYFADKTSAEAGLVWKDSATDLAILKTEVNMPYLETSGITDVKVGEDVVAIGTPLTLQFKHTTTKGIVSALNRTLETNNDDGSISYMQNLIQHDASINPGNSGGPLINSSGQVIGINSLKITDAEGLGFAIPIDVVVPVMQQILKNGSYETPYLGLFGFDASIAKFYGKTLNSDGVYVLNLDNLASAYKSGLKEGDIITSINENEISTLLDLRKNLYKYNVGETIEMKVLRNGGEEKINVKLLAR
ncbi:MAG: serine protease [Clostridia bacterium]|nr:serine protease [Clostridia bacterium]